MTTKVLLSLQHCEWVLQAPCPSGCAGHRSVRFVQCARVGGVKSLLHVLVSVYWAQPVVKFKELHDQAASY